MLKKLKRKNRKTKSRNQLRRKFPFLLIKGARKINLSMKTTKT